MIDGFLGRWSQRKQAVRAGKPLLEPVAKPEAAQALASARDASISADTASALQTGGVNPSPEPVPPPPPPSMQDVASLDRDSDFGPFVSRAVASAVRNAAMKKLFADPHFNIMDGLDTYIDDYSLADPLPEAMLRKMASAKFLGLFEDEQQDAHAEPQAGAATDAADKQAVPTLTRSGPPEPAAPAPDQHVSAPKGADHDHTDLRLQQDHAVGPAQPGGVAE